MFLENTIDLATDPRCKLLYEKTKRLRRMMEQLVNKDYTDPFETEYAKYMSHNPKHIQRKIDLAESIVANGFNPTWKRDQHIRTYLDYRDGTIGIQSGQHRYAICMILVEQGIMTEIRAAEPNLTKK